jgi:small subunit ribosomal protein S20
MPHSASAKKRHRQNLRNRERNRAVKSDLKTQVRKLLEAISAGDVAKAKDELRAVAKKADRAAASKTIHKNRAARIKSRLTARVKSVGSTTAAGGKARKAAKA